MWRIGVYPGTFDPVTHGHLNLMVRASRLVDRLIVGVAGASEKLTRFTASQRAQMIRESLEEPEYRDFFSHVPVEVHAFEGLLISFAKSHGCSLILRGLRAVSDFEYESQMACMNARMAPDIATVFLPASDTHQCISSRLVKQIADLGGDIRSFVPASVMHGFDRWQSCMPTGA